MPLLDIARGWLRGGLPTWYHPSYRLPMATLEARTGFETRRADFAVWTLLDRGALRARDVHEPMTASYRELCLIHTASWLDAIQDPERLAAVFVVDPRDCPVDEVVHTLRLAVGGTIAAARHAVRRRGPTLNTLGGFHHAAPDRGSGFCAANDIAVAVAVLRTEGFKGQIAVLDLDAHPPDGTAACLVGDPQVWIGSLSGVDWGLLPRVDETVLAPGTGDLDYLAALTALVDRMPRAELTFVIAGGDPLAGDPLGNLGVSLAGLRKRDLLVARALAGRASVWLPGGGYTDDSWRVLAGTALAVGLLSTDPLPAGLDPLRARYAAISAGILQSEIDDNNWITEADLAADLGISRATHARLLGTYSREGLELLLERFGILSHLRRLGYQGFQIELDRNDVGERMRVLARGPTGDALHMLVECVLERQVIDGTGWLFVHWLTLRHPLAAFSALRPQLPGQEVPGLGMVREATELLGRAAARLDLAGLAIRPAWYHVAVAARLDMGFQDAARQARFEGLMRCLRDVPLLDATRLVANGRVLLDGAPYSWEADLMLSPKPQHSELPPIGTFTLSPEPVSP
jgi:acetoin utilization deacetylase AcuC-like enzyme